MVTVASGDDAGIGADTGADARMSADAYAGAGERSMGVGVSARNWGCRQIHADGWTGRRAWRR